MEKTGNASDFTLLVLLLVRIMSGGEQYRVGYRTFGAHLWHRMDN